MGKPSISIIGAGKVGTALAYLLARKGYPVAVVASSRLESAKAAVSIVGQGIPSMEASRAVRQAQVVFITTPDKAIAPAAQEIAMGQSGKSLAGKFIFHCSGALPSSVLKPLKSAGACIGSLHPIQTFADVNQAINFLPGSYFGFEGDQQAEPVAQHMAEDLDGKLLKIRAEDKALYHAAAVFACNYLATLAHIGVELLQMAGISKEDALPALLPLIEGTVNNLDQVGLPQALTGPIARGDIVTVIRHIEAIRDRIPALLPVYCQLARETIELAEEKGSAAPEALEKLKSLL